MPGGTDGGSGDGAVGGSDGGGGEGSGGGGEGDGGGGEGDGGGGEGDGGGGEGDGGGGDGGGGDGGGGLGGVDGGAEGGVEGGINPMYSLRASKRELWASKRDFTSAISGEQAHVVVELHGAVLSAPMPFIRQEATRHLSSTVPLNLRGATLERLLAWDMRSESRSCAEHERKVAASNIGPAGVASGGGRATTSGCAAEAGERAGTSRGAETPGTELREQSARRDGAGGVRGRG